MKKILRMLRKAGFMLVLIIAAFAVGITGHILPAYRGRPENKRTTTEQVEKKRKDE